LRGWDERRQAIAQAVDKATRTRELLARYGIACPNVTGAGTGSFEFEAVSGLYTELQCGSYIFMDADYGRNRDRDGGPFTTFEPSLFVWATVMSRPAKDRAIVDAGLKALAFDSGPPLVCDEPAATYERASDEHGRLAVSAATNRLGLGDKIRLIPATAIRPSISTTGMSVSAATASSSSGRSPQGAPCIDARGRAEHEASLRGRPSAVRIISTTVDWARFLVNDTFGPKSGHPYRPLC
jgi:hypothetical protein